MEVVSIVCDTCGGNLKHLEGEKYQCGSCRSFKFVREYTNEELFLLQSADICRVRMKNFFSAVSAYDNLLKINPQNTNALWGLFLSEYGVEYIKDAEEGVYRPIFHKLFKGSVSKNKYCKKAIELAYGEEKEKYIKDSQEIEKIHSEILKEKEKNEKYDIFLCYKKDTPEEEWAEYFTKLFNDYGLTVFKADKKMKGSAGEPVIFNALYTARIFILLCSTEDHLDSLDGEWKRFLNRKLYNGDTRLCVVHSKEVDPYNFSREMQPDNVQYGVKFFDYTGKNDCVNNLLNVIKEIGSIDRKMSDAFALNKAKEDLLEIKNGAKNIEAGKIIFFGSHTFTRSIRAEVNINPDGSHEVLCGGGETVKLPLLWRVLENDGKELFLLSEYVLEGMKYNETDRGEDEEVSWANSSIRNRLKNDFFEETFSDEEKKLINETCCRKNALREAETGDDNEETTEEEEQKIKENNSAGMPDETFDLVFLLNLFEAEAMGEEDRIAKFIGTDDEVKWYLRSIYWPARKGHVRSPIKKRPEFTVVNSEGKIEHYTDDRERGIRPAIKVRLI